MITICIYIEGKYVGYIVSKVMLRKNEELKYKGKDYTVSRVFYDTEDDRDFDRTVVENICIEIEPTLV